METCGNPIAGKVDRLINRGLDRGYGSCGSIARQRILYYDLWDYGNPIHGKSRDVARLMIRGLDRGSARVAQ